MRTTMASWSSSLLARFGLVRRKRSKGADRRLKAKRSLRIESLEPREMLNCGPLTDEYLVNSHTAGVQQFFDSGHSIAAMPDGGSLVSWGSYAQDGSGWGVYAQRQNSVGEPLGSEIQVNTTTTGDQLRSSVSVAPDGTSIVVWQSQGQDGSGAGIYARRLDAEGSPLSGEFQVNTTTVGNQELPAVAHLGDGGFVVVWSGRGTGDNSGVFARRFTAECMPYGNEFRVNTAAQAQQKQAAIAATADSGFVVAWTGYGGPEAESHDVFAQRFSSASQKVGGQFRVNSTTQSQQGHVALAAAPQGGFLAVWQSKHADGSGFAICGQRYSEGGMPIGGEFVVNTTTAGDQVAPAAAYDSRGGFLITWSGEGAGDTSGVFGRKYGADGAPVGAEFLVNGTTAGDQARSSVAAAGSGYVVSWDGNGTDDSGGVFARHFGSGPITLGIANIEVAEDAPQQVVDLWAAFQDAENAGHALQYEVVANSNPRLFSSTVIDSDLGHLLLDLTPNGWGTASLTVRATDPGGLFAETTFQVVVSSVNDAPFVRMLPTITVDEDSRPSTIPLSAVFGDVDDFDLVYSLVDHTNPGLFAAAPSITPRGELVLRYAPNAFGEATVTVRATDAQGVFTDATLNVTVAAVNDAPTAAPDTVLRVRLNAAATEIDIVKLFRDVEDGSGGMQYELVGNSNPVLMTGHVNPFARKLLVSYQTGQWGEATLTLRATDSGGLTADHVIHVTVNEHNEAPAIGRFDVGPSPVVEGATLKLRAADVIDDGRVAHVAFYRDTDGDGLFNPAVDVLLGNDTDGADGWSLSVTTEGFGAGPQRYFALATDDEGLTGNIVSVDSTVGIEAILDNGQPGYAETGTGWRGREAEDARGGTVREHSAGTGENIARWTFEGLPELNYRVFVTWTAAPTNASNATYLIYDGDELIGTFTVDQRRAPRSAYHDGTWWHELLVEDIHHSTLRVELSDAADGTVVADAVRLVDPPTIGSLTVSSSSVARGDTITLTANNVTFETGQTPKNVAFYLDLDQNGSFNPSVDLLLGKDIDSTDGWSFVLTTNNYQSGQQRVFAVATAVNALGQSVASSSATATFNISSPGASGALYARAGEYYYLSLGGYGGLLDGYWIDWGDGQADTSTSHEYYGGPCTITISDGETGPVLNTISVHFLDNPSQTNASIGLAQSSVAEGSPFQLWLQPGTISGSSQSYQWDYVAWGDGTETAVDSAPWLFHYYEDNESSHDIIASPAGYSPSLEYVDNSFYWGSGSVHEIDIVGSQILATTWSGSVARLNSTGQTLGTINVSSIAGEAQSTVVLEDTSELLIGGTLWRVARCSADGTNLALFAQPPQIDGVTPGDICSILVHEGTVYVLGESSAGMVVMRYGANGQFLSVTQLIDPSGYGGFTGLMAMDQVGGTSQLLIAGSGGQNDDSSLQFALDLEGELLSQSSTYKGGQYWVRGIATLASGSAFVLEETYDWNTYSYQFNVPTSQMDGVNSVAVHSDGSILVGGSEWVDHYYYDEWGNYYWSGTDRDLVVQRFSSTWSPDGYFAWIGNCGSDEAAYALALQEDNKILVGNEFGAIRLYGTPQAPPPSWSWTTTAYTTNVAPTLTVVGNQTIDLGETLELPALATFTDPGIGETYTCSIDWGDDQTTSPSSTDIRNGEAGVPTSGTYGASHTYSASGNYTVTVTVSDGAGSPSIATFQVTVLGPTVLTWNPVDGSGDWQAEEAWVDQAGNRYTWDSAATGYVAAFSGTGNVVTVDGSISVAGMQFYTNSNCVIQGSGTIALTGAAEIATHNGSRATIYSVLVGADGLTKSGPGTLELRGANTYLGETTIAQGTLNIEHPNSLGTGDIVNNDVLHLRYTGGSEATLENSISGSGRVEFDNYGYGEVIVLGNNTYAGGTTVSGVLQIGNGGSTGNIQGPVGGGGRVRFHRDGPLTFDGTFLPHVSLEIAAGTIFTLNSPGPHVLPNGFDSRGVLHVNGTLDLNGFDACIGIVVGAGTITSSSPCTLTVVAPEVNHHGPFDGVLSGSLALVKLGPGLLCLSGKNTYTGGTTIKEGSLGLAKLEDPAYSGLGMGPVLNNSILTFLSGWSEIATIVDNLISGTGIVRVERNVTFTADNTYTGGTDIWGLSRLGMTRSTADWWVTSLGRASWSSAGPARPSAAASWAASA